VSLLFYMYYIEHS